MYYKNELLEISKNYDEIIRLIAKFFIDLGIQDDPIKIMKTFYAMYRIGYLSTKSFTVNVPIDLINLEKEKIIPFDLCGSFIMSGYGCCRHVSDLLYRIFKELNYNSSQLFVYDPIVSVSCTFKNEKHDCFCVNECVRKSLNKIDLCGKSKKTITKRSKGVKINVTYTPIEKDTSLNHVLNIVVDNNDFRHIVDASKFSIGRKNDGVLLMQGPIYEYYDFIKSYKVQDSFYMTDYSKGISLLDYCDDYLNDYNKFMNDKLNFSELKEAFKCFHEKNSGYFEMVDTGLKSLARNK